MGLVRKIHTRCMFLGIYVYITVLLILTCMSCHKALNSVLHDDLMNITETYGTVKNM